MAVTLPTVGGSSGTWGTTLNAAFDEFLNSGRTALEYPMVDKGGQVYNVKAYGATGDGTTDDRSAIQTAINTCGAAGGGVVYFPPGTYRLNSATLDATGGTPAALVVSYDNVRLVGCGPTSIIKNTTAPVSSTEVADIFIGGVAKKARVATGDVSDWSDYHWFSGSSAPTLYDLTGTQTIGTQSLQLDTAYPSAGTFAAGDWICIRTGQTLATPNFQPVAEVNRVRSYNNTTGVIELYYPLQHTYQQEYYISGTSGLTSTSVTANPAPFGVLNVTDRILTGFGIDNLHLDHQTFQYVILGMGVAEPVAERITGVLEACAFWSVGAAFRPIWRNSDVHGYDVSGAIYVWGIDTGGTDGLVENVQVTSEDGAVYFHFHEGATGRLRNVTLQCPSVNADRNLVSIRARARADVQNCTFQGGGFIQIFVGAECVEGGYIGGNVHRSPSFTSDAVAIQDGAIGWTVAPSQVFDDLNTVVPDVFNNNLIGGVITVPARQCAVTTGTAGAATKIPGTGVSLYEMDNGVQTGISFATAIPPEWRTFDVYVSCANLGTTGGTFETALIAFRYASGDDITGEQVIISQAPTHTALGQYERQLVRAAAVSATHVPGEEWGLEVYRQTTGTLAESVGFLTIYLIRTG